MFLRIVLTGILAVTLLSLTMALMGAIVHEKGTPFYPLVAPVTAAFFMGFSFALESLFRQKDELRKFTSTMAYQRLTGLARYRQLLKF